MSPEEAVEITRQPLYLLMQQRFQDMDKAVLAALTAQKDAVDKAEESATKRFDEFKREIGEKLDSLITSRDTGSARGVLGRELIGYLLAIASIAALIIVTHPWRP